MAISKKMRAALVPTDGLSIAGPVYERAVIWIAGNESTHTHSAQFLRHSPAVCLLASLAGVGTERVAEDAIRYRRYG